MPISNILSSALTGVKTASDVYAANIARSEGFGNAQLPIFHAQVTTLNNYGGVDVVVIQDNKNLGNIQNSNVSTNMSLDVAKNFFVVSSSPTDLSTIQYTRDGSFDLDKDGYFVNSAGNYLLGWPVDPITGQIPATTNTSLVSGLVAMNASSISGTFSATTAADIRATLPSNDPIGQTRICNIRAVDSQGIGHNIQTTLTKTATANRWSLALSCPDAATITKPDGNAYNGATSILIQFDDNGILQGFYNDSTLNSPLLASPPLINIAWSGGYLAPSAIALNLGTPGLGDGLKIMGSTYGLIDNSDNGREVASVTGVSINTSGTIETVLTGDSSTPIGQIALAYFNNANGLQINTGDTFSQTDDSGNYILCQANQNGNARVLAGTIEKSPIETSQQLISLLSMQNFNSILVRSLSIENDMEEKLTHI